MRTHRLSLSFLVLLVGPGLATGALAVPAAAQELSGYVNVRSFGAAGNGTTDDTAAIGRALTAVRNGGKGGVLYFPAGTYRTNGNHDVTLINGLSIVGDGIGATTFRIAHPSNDLFFWTFSTAHQTYRDFSVRSDTVSRTGGWVLRGRAPASDAFGALVDSRIRDIDIKDQVNGIWLSKYAFVWVDRVLMTSFVGSGGIGLKAGQTTSSSSSFSQGSNLYIQGTEIYANDRTGADRPLKLAFAFVIEDADSVFMTDSGTGGALISGLKIIANAGGHAPTNLFFKQSVFDATCRGPSAHVTGGGVVLNLTFTGCWFASAGMGEDEDFPPGSTGSIRTNGCNTRPATLLLDVNTLGLTQVTGGRFFNAKGDGIRMRSAAAPGNAAVALTGVIVTSNQGDGISVETPVNALGPVISGVDETSSGGVGLRTGSTTNRIVVVGNRFQRGMALGVPPQVLANNGQ